MDSQSIDALFKVLVLVLLIWTTLLSMLTLMQRQFFSDFTKKVSKKDLKSCLQDLSKDYKQVYSTVKKQGNQIQDLIEHAKSHYQKVGFIRFNPYSDTGGDQSFCVCLLDDTNSGIVITSLHSREQTRMYAKTIKSGKVEGSELSREEVETLKIAMKK